MPLERGGKLSESGLSANNVRQSDATGDARNVSDRRLRKTRTALLASFDRLLILRGYDQLHVCELAANADVGRSTLYEHFAGKEDLLEHSVARFIRILAAATASGAPSDGLRDLLTHVGMQRSLSNELLQWPARGCLVRVLARELERCLEAIARRSAAGLIAPVPFLAVSLAHAQLGAVDAWLSSDNCCDVRTAAAVLHATTRAGVAAMFALSA